MQLVFSTLGDAIVQSQPSTAAATGTSGQEHGPCAVNHKTQKHGEEEPPFQQLSPKHIMQQDEDSKLPGDSEGATHKSPQGPPGHVDPDEYRILAVMSHLKERYISGRDLAKRMRTSKKEINQTLRVLQGKDLVKNVGDTPPLWALTDHGRLQVQETGRIYW